MIRPTIAISSCLLGEKVRHDGQHKRDDWLVDELGKFVEWLPLCPEMAMGLGAPRDTIHLERQGEEIVLVNAKNKTDLTFLAQKTAKKIYPQNFTVDAYIWKKNSPSCGLEKVKIHRPQGGMPEKKGTGIFAEYFKTHFSQVPCIEEGRLTDVAQREFFLIRLYFYSRYKALKNTYQALEDFQRTNKLLMMGLAPQKQKDLGKILAQHKTKNWEDIRQEYQQIFFLLLASPWKPARQVNVLEHILGYFKDYLTAREKKLIVQEIFVFKNGRVPLMVPLRIFYHLSEKYQVKYLIDQSYFAPYPDEININV